MSDKIEKSAFTAWQKAHGSIFYLMLAYRHGMPDTLRMAATMLQTAAETCFAALPEEDETSPEAIAAAPCHLRPVIEARRIAQTAADCDDSDYMRAIIAEEIAMAESGEVV